jgi:flap endonuclease-1
MGVDIGELFKKEKITFNDLRDRIIAIDAYNVLHQFLSIIRQRDGTPLKDSKGRITSHLSGLFYRTANMVEARIRPVYVFDGEPHLLKAKTIQQRKERKEQAEKEWKEAIEKGDLKTARIKAQQTSRVTDEIIEQSEALLTALGIPYIHAPSEGEAQASYMVKKGDAYAVGSQDFDCLLFNAPVLVRNLTSSGKRKLQNH